MYEKNIYFEKNDFLTIFYWKKYENFDKHPLGQVWANNRKPALCVEIIKFCDP